MKIPLATLVLVSTACLVHAQDSAEPSKLPPATKLEAFSARTGTVLIKAFSTVGVVSGIGRVTIDAREFRDASNLKNREYGITVAVKEGGRLERENTSFVDSEEIDSLIKGIDYIAKVDKGVTSMNEFEATYRTKGDFAITTFSSRSEIKGSHIERQNWQNICLCESQRS